MLVGHRFWASGKQKLTKVEEASFSGGVCMVSEWSDALTRRQPILKKNDQSTVSVQPRGGVDLNALAGYIFSVQT